MSGVDLATMLQCPQCGATALAGTDMSIGCTHCHKQYPVVGGIPLMLSVASNDSFKDEMIAFWAGGWQKRRTAEERAGTKERLLQELGAVRFFLALEDAEQVREMSALDLVGKIVLEVGCGVGTSSALFALDGARVVASDLTAPAVAMAREKFRILGLDGAQVQADGEHLPFRDNTFDVVFSSGVLHHTPGTQQAVDELYRVLKPGGDVVVMLYAKWSFQYLVSLLFVRGILLGGLFRYGWSQWLGKVTEANWRTASKRLNPLTKVYSSGQMKRLFHRFRILSIRKHSFNWADLCPGLYRIVPRRILPLGDTGTIIPSAVEVAIGRRAGFSLVIHGKKPQE